jgi:hypothetical protein
MVQNGNEVTVRRPYGRDLIVIVPRVITKMLTSELCHDHAGVEPDQKIGRSPWVEIFGASVFGLQVRVLRRHLPGDAVSPVGRPRILNDAQPAFAVAALGRVNVLRAGEALRRPRLCGREQDEDEREENSKDAWLRKGRPLAFTERAMLSLAINMTELISASVFFAGLTN